MKINKQFNFYTLSAEWKNWCLTSDNLSEIMEPDIHLSIDMDESLVKDHIVYLQFKFEETYGIGNTLENIYIAAYLMLFDATILSKSQLSEQNIKIQSNHKLDLYWERAIRNNNFGDTFTALDQKHRAQVDTIFKNKALIKETTQ